MKIYDCFTFFNELDLLEIRLNELNDVVDYFVLVEGENTFQGNSKKLFFAENKERFSNFLHKIIHVVIPANEMPTGQNWENERKSFNYFINGISPAPEDIIMLSALDEIPKNTSIKEAVIKTPCTMMLGHYYFFLDTRYWTNTRENNLWHGTTVYRYDQLNSTGKDYYDTFLKKTESKVFGGWHFSFLGDAKNAVSKVNSYSHSEYNALDENFYLDKINSLQDPFGRSNFTGFDFFEKNEDLPVYVQNNLDRFSKYLRNNISSDEIITESNTSTESYLTILGKKYSTDKSTYHNFTNFYDEHLNPHKENVRNMLEIGIYNGSSLKMWKEYFVNSEIYAIDVHDMKQYDSDRIHTFVCDQTNHSLLNDLFSEKDFDLIIDDGGHTMDQQQKSILSLFSKLKSNGFYIIEDLHTSLRPGHYGVNNTSQTTLEFVKSLTDDSRFESNHMGYEGFLEIKNMVDKVYIFEQVQNDEFGKSITAIIYKK